MSTRPFYDDDDVHAFGPHPRQGRRGGWGLLAPQVFGIGDYQPPTRRAERALCAEVDPDLFFPEIGAGAQTAPLAKRICGRCPLKSECLEEAIANQELYGIWGGTTPLDRRIIRRRRNMIDDIPAAVSA